ncbi:putative nicotinate-nucleotide adenylyltransferase [Polymorphobacter multimanifer]|uniref:nicotinate-nucleotide adenylyltransferase n=2 Tax=Polymorphobacter multimanifer TaxID=1070431 RepID=A0A841LCL8_9SPHN|nr:nicotinate-nucleotide adenylyltransferase [Polymorphobacter multimanifer]GGI83795.1 putative nicotinate-nucleotide adenylyltransferase [Polymorphobacter multimanifer]
MRLLGLDEVWWLVSPQNPLKPQAGMASLEARLASAQAAARHPRILPTAIEVELGTRFAVDTVAALQRSHPGTRFIWLAGADILTELHRWHRWRAFASQIPIAVFARPGYLGAALTAPAMAWLRRWRRPASQAGRWTAFGAPAILVFNIRTSPLSATSLRKSDPAWYRRHINTLEKARP